MNKEKLQEELVKYTGEAQVYYNMWQQATGVVAYIKHQLEKLEKEETKTDAGYGC